MTEYVQSETEDGVTTLTLARPEKKNALTQAMYARLVEALSEATADEAVRLVRLRGAGEDFTAGNDLHDFQAASQSGLNRDELPVAGFLHAVVDFPKPLVAQVRGNAVGIGTTVLLHCELVVAATDSRFAMPFVPLGLVPEFASSGLLPRLAGYQQAARLLLFGEPFDAAAAERIGLVAHVCEPAALEAVTLAYCRKLAALPPGAIQATKALLRPQVDRQALHALIDTEREVFSERLQSPEHRAAAEAFFARSRG